MRLARSDEEGGVRLELEVPAESFAASLLCLAEVDERAGACAI